MVSDCIGDPATSGRARTGWSVLVLAIRPMRLDEAPKRHIRRGLFQGEASLGGVKAIIDLLSQLRPRGNALWRRRWIALGTAWGLMLLGSTVVMLLPDQYEAFFAHLR